MHVVSGPLVLVIVSLICMKLHFPFSFFHNFSPSRLPFNCDCAGKSYNLPFYFFPFRHSDKRTWQRSSWWQEAYIIYILGFLRSSHGHTSVPMLFPFIEVNRISAFISRFSYLRFETFLCWATWHAKRTYEMYAYFFNFTYYIHIPVNRWIFIKFVHFSIWNTKKQYKTERVNWRIQFLLILSLRNKYILWLLGCW